MAIYVGTSARETHQVTMTCTSLDLPVSFDTPADFVLYMERRPDIREQVLNGEWSWET